MNLIRGHKKIERITILFFFAALIAVFLYAVIGTVIRPHDIDDEWEQAQIADFTWTVQQVDGTQKAVELPYEPNIKAGQSVTLTTTIPSYAEDNMVLTLRPDQIDMEAYVHGELREDYSTTDTRFFGKVPSRRYIFMHLNGTDAGKVLSIKLMAQVDGMGRFETTYYGEKAAIVREMIDENMLDIFIAVFMFIVSVLCLILGIALGIGLKTRIEMNYLSVVGILASVWILCNAEVSQLYFANGSLSIHIDYMMLMLLPFPFLFFVNSVQENRFHKLYMVFEIIAVLCTMVCTTLALTNVYDLSQMFFGIAGVLGASLIMILITILIDVIRYRNHNYMILSVGVFAGVISCLIQLGFYLGGKYDFGGNAVGIALLIMLSSAVVETYRKIRKIELDKQIAIAERSAESRFLVNMSHEIRTPINAVLGMNEMILRESKEKEILEYARNIDNSGNMLLSIINDILDFSKVASGKMDIIPVTYSLCDMVKDVTNMIQVKADAKNLKFQVKIDACTPNDLMGDEVRVKQIVINLLTNAVKYTDQGSVILEIAPQTIEPGCVQLRMAVKDTGRGIRKEDQDKLFEAFNRVDEKNNRNIEGTGLGLALVKELVNAMGGSLTVDSIYGQGSTFCVMLPQEMTAERTYQQALTSQKTEEVKVETQGFVAPDAKILVVDDTKMNLLVVKGLLKRTQMQVTTAESGEACLELVRDNRYDIILLDHLMPQMDGIETLHKLREAGYAKDSVIIALTANAMSGAREQYMEAGFHDYLSKPVRSDELETMLAHYLCKEE